MKYVSLKHVTALLAVSMGLAATASAHTGHSVLPHLPHGTEIFMVLAALGIVAMVLRRRA